ncbi:MAG TPA: hypothetical protein VFD48_06775, partial [Pyrinomonadaceae bacterium]|nr:hypothetical protein [Pyrinomonadaceae bacterium]
MRYLLRARARNVYSLRRVYKHSGALRRGRNRRSAGAKKSQNEAAKLAAVIEKEEKRWRYARKSAL